MDNRNLEKAIEIFGTLVSGEEISKEAGKNVELYEEYNNNMEVNNILDVITKKLNLRLYEYNDAIYISGGDHNKVFGFTNEELKRVIGVKLNKELYLCYFIIYQIITKFYNDSANYTYIEYVKIEDVISAVDSAFINIISDINIFVKSEVEENSFKALAILWDEMPVSGNDDGLGIKASRSTKAGFVKLVFNFMISQGLFLESEERYYPKKRLKAIVKNYFEEERGRLYEIISEEEQKNATY